MIRLPATDLDDYKHGIQHFYGVKPGNYAKGQRVILYNGNDQALFRIEDVLHIDGMLKLGLRRVENVKNQ